MPYQSCSRIAIVKATNIEQKLLRSNSCLGEPEFSRNGTKVFIKFENAKKISGQYSNLSSNSGNQVQLYRTLNQICRAFCSQFNQQINTMVVHGTLADK